MPSQVKILLVDITGKVLKEFDAVAAHAAKDTSEFYLTRNGKIIESVVLKPGQALIFSEKYARIPSETEKDLFGNELF